MEFEYTSSINKETLINVLERLYKAKAAFPYSSLALVLKPADLFNFFDIFGGTTLEVPSKEEMIHLIQVCLVEEFNSFEEAKAAYPEVLHGLSKKQYDRISKKLNS